MTKSAEQTTSWVAGNISQMDEVREAEVIGSNYIHITRKKQKPFIAGIGVTGVRDPYLIRFAGQRTKDRGYVKAGF